MEYHAVYDGTIDLSAIEEQLNESSIKYSRYVMTNSNTNESWSVIEFNFGRSFNNSDADDTYCIIRETQPFYDQVQIRLYGADTHKRSELEQYKPAIENSMDLVIAIIYDATGKNPISLDYFFEDGSALEYPDHSNIILLSTHGEKNDL